MKQTNFYKSNGTKRQFKVDFNEAQKAEFIARNGENAFNSLPFSDPRLGGSSTDRREAILEKHPELKKNES